MLGPIDIDSLDFQARCQLLRLEFITGESRAENLRRAVAIYYQEVMAAATDEQLREANRRAEEWHKRW